MRQPPAVDFSLIQGANSARLIVAALSSLALACSAWVVLSHTEVGLLERCVLGSWALATLGHGAGQCQVQWRSHTASRLLWTGRRWQLLLPDGARELERVEVAWDAGRLMLLRLHSFAAIPPAEQWVVVTGFQQSATWHGLRMAVMHARPDPSQANSNAGGRP